MAIHDNLGNGATRARSSNNLMSDVTVPPPVESDLNPMAREWDPHNHATPQESRSVFMTFSKGFPVFEEEVHLYLARKFGGGSIEKVSIKKPNNPKNQPMFGIVVFTTCAFPLVVLRENGGNGEEARHYIGGRPVEFKKFRRPY